MNDRKFNLGDVVRVTGGGKRGVVVKISTNKRRGTKVTVMPTDMVTGEFLWSFSTGLAETIAVFDPDSFVSSPENLSLMFMGRADLYFAAKRVYEEERVDKKKSANRKKAEHLRQRKIRNLDNLDAGDILLLDGYGEVTFDCPLKLSGRIQVRNSLGKTRLVDPADLTRP